MTFALVITCVSAAAASAGEPYWLVNGKKLAKEEEKEANSSLSKQKWVIAGLGTIECPLVADREVVVGPNKDRTSEYKFGNCAVLSPSGCTILPPTPSSLPWPTALRPGTGIADLTEGIAFSFTIEGVSCSINGTYEVTGNLEGNWNNATPAIEYPETPLSGSTLKMAGKEVVVSGTDKLELREGGTLEAGVETEGPFYSVNGKTLKSGETRLLLVAANANWVFTSTAFGITILCQGSTLPVTSEMQIIGSVGLTGARSLEAIEFTGCLQEGNKSEPECEVEGNRVQTKLLLGLLGYSTATRSGPLLELFAPDTGKVLGTVKFLGTCSITSGAMEGTLVGLPRVGGVKIQVNAATETLHGEVAFDGASSTVWLERGGTLSSVKSSFSFIGGAAKLQGLALLLVDEGILRVKWGIFS